MFKQDICTLLCYEPFFKENDRGVLVSEKKLELSKPKKNKKTIKYTYNVKDKSTFYLLINNVKISEVQLKLSFGICHISDMFKVV